MSARHTFPPQDISAEEIDHVFLTAKQAIADRRRAGQPVVEPMLPWSRRSMALDTVIGITRVSSLARHIFR